MHQIGLAQIGIEQILVPELPEPVKAPVAALLQLEQEESGAVLERCHGDHRSRTLKALERGLDLWPKRGRRPGTELGVVRLRHKR
jgi:hypothetical protein